MFWGGGQIAAGMSSAELLSLFPVMSVRLEFQDQRYANRNTKFSGKQAVMCMSKREMEQIRSSSI